MQTVAVIPARGGSKSIPKKNIRLFRGRPLIAISIETALACPSIERTIVSTDSEEIASIARQYGAYVPFIRPADLAMDDTPDLPVFVHCLEWLEKNENIKPEIIVHLRPTSPLRTVSMVEQAIQILKDYPEADSVRAVCEPSQNPFKMWEISGTGFMTPLIKTGITEQYNQPRQSLPKVFWQNGYIDVTRRVTILEKRSMTGMNIKPLITDHTNMIDIDNDITFRLAEEMYLKRTGGLK